MNEARSSFEQPQAQFQPYLLSSSQTATGYPPQQQSALTAPPHREIRHPQQTPPPLPQYGGPPTEWSTGLCDCLKDPGDCCLTFWCPCITFGQIAEIVDEGSPSCVVSGLLYGVLYFTGCGRCYSCLYRTRMRSKFNLAESPCEDCLVHCCCDNCAICQEHRELKNKGLDPALGWVGNLQRQQRQQRPMGMGIDMTAPPAQTMSIP